MSLIQLTLNNQLTDIDNSVKIVTDRVVSAFRNPTAATGTYTYSFKLPATPNNRRILQHADDRQVVAKFNTMYQAVVSVDGVRVIKGLFELTSVKGGFTGNIIGTVIAKLGDIIDPKKTLRQITSFAKFNFNGNATVADYLRKKTLSYYPATQSAADKSDIAFAYVYDSFAAFTSNGKTHDVDYEDLGISHFTGSVVEKIIADAGYTVAGNILTDDLYRKNLLLYSNADAVPQQWNYGTLAPFKSVAPTYIPYRITDNIANTIERIDDKVYVVQPLFQKFQGDLCNSMGSDGVYTCKSSGLYTFRMKCPVTVMQQLPNQAPTEVTCKYFIAFREISTTEFLTDKLLPSNTNFDVAGASHFITNLDTYFIGDGNFALRMVEGKQYAVQAYVSIPKSYAYGTFSVTPTVGLINYLECTKMDGKLLVNPAEFLPNMTCAEFLSGMFRLHNLYYTMDTDTKTVTLYKRDEFFRNTVDGLVDVTDLVDETQWEDTPISATDIANSYYKWKSDDSDYILKTTDYMNRVNGGTLPHTVIGGVIVPVPVSTTVDGVTTITPLVNPSPDLPFAPLAFVEATFPYYTAIPDYTQTKQITDFFPAIIPFDESNDTLLLTNPDAVNKNAYSPRICTFLGNVFTDNYNRQQLNYRYLVPLTGYQGGHSIDGNLYAPKLTFFDLNHQLAYRIDINALRRDFSLLASDTPTIFANGEAFIQPITSQGLDLVSPNSSFATNYKEVIRINSYANYVTTVLRVNPVLYEKLNGRYLLRINNLTYLLESVTDYDMEHQTAKVTLYRNI